MVPKVSPNSSLKNGPRTPSGSVDRTSATFLRTWYQAFGTSFGGVKSLSVMKIIDSPGFE